MASVRVYKKNRGQGHNAPTTVSPAPTDDNISYLTEIAARKRLIAIANTELFQNYAHSLFDVTGAEVGIPCIKAKNKIVAKAAGEYDGDINKVGDVLRMKIICDSAEQLQQIRAILWHQQELTRSTSDDQVKPQTPQVESVHDYFAVPLNHGYRAFNVKVLMPDGLIAEIQVTHRGLEDTYDYTHKPYDAMRRLTHQVDTEQGGIFNDEQARRYGKLVMVIAQAYDAVSEENGLNELLSPKGREKVEKRQQWMKQFAAENRTAKAEDMLPEWKRKKPSQEETLSERLIKLGFEIERGGDDTPPPIADAYATLVRTAQEQFSTFPLDEQNAIRSLLTQRKRKSEPEVRKPATPSVRT